MSEEREEATGAKEQGGFALFDKYQAGVLTDRYLETVLSDWKNTGLLVLQAPVLALMAVMVFDNVGRATASLYFVMVLSLFWIGCMNACREICKERPLFLRERMFNLDVGAYLYSKIRVLSLVGTVQVGLYSFIVMKWIDVRVPVGWVLVSLLFTMLCGTSLGLLISSVVKRSDYAVGLVPLVIIPQIVFSEFTIEKSQFRGLSETLFLAMPSRWSFEALKEFAQTSPDVIEGALHLLPLLGYSALFLLIAYPILRLQKY